MRMTLLSARHSSAPHGHSLEVRISDHRWLGPNLRDEPSESRVHRIVRQGRHSRYEYGGKSGQHGTKSKAHAKNKAKYVLTPINLEDQTANQHAEKNSSRDVSKAIRESD